MRPVASLKSRGLAATQPSGRTNQEGATAPTGATKKAHLPAPRNTSFVAGLPLFQDRRRADAGGAHRDVNGLSLCRRPQHCLRSTSDEQGEAAAKRPLALQQRAAFRAGRALRWIVFSVSVLSSSTAKEQSMVQKLANKVAFITGGNSGIGLASARQFAEQGATVVILARSQKKADKALPGISGDATAVVGDVSDLKSLKSAFDAIRDAHGRIDILMTSAGIVPVSVLGETDESIFDNIFGVNVKGTFFAVQYAMPLLSKGASVILVCSCVHEMGSQGYALYNATKAAVRSLARSLTPDLAPMGVRVNVLSPGPIQTPVLENSGLSTENIEAVRETFSQRLAAGRVGRPEEMAKVALFLASDDSSYMYGSDVQADGGMNQVRW